MQHMRFLLFLIVLISAFSSCTIPNPFNDIEETTYPDTTVYINSLTPQICEVKISDTDSTNAISIYWTDRQTGRIVYKMEDAPYKKSRLHGVQYKYNENGDTLLIANFENGIRIDSTVYYYVNGIPKHKYFYSQKKDGNIVYEIQYHESGRKKTDLIAYEDGLLNGAVHYYADADRAKITETYFYREGELIGIKIYNEIYAALDRKRDLLISQYQADSIRIAEALLASANDNSFSSDVPVFYIGTERDGMYDLGTPDDWDIMKEDPVFMLKYYNR